MKKIIVCTLYLLLLMGCVSSADMNRQFYSGMEQRGKEFSEALGIVANYIGWYEGNPSSLQDTMWQDSMLDASETLVGKARGLYSIVDTYCPKDEKILCDDIELLYNKVRTLHGSLEAAIKMASTDQMDSAIQKFEEVLAHLEAMNVAQVK